MGKRKTNTDQRPIFRGREGDGDVDEDLDTAWNQVENSLYWKSYNYSSPEIKKRMIGTIENSRNPNENSEDTCNNQCKIDDNEDFDYIGGFDFDGCIVDDTDLKKRKILHLELLHPTAVIEKLTKLYLSRYKIIIVSNQKGISSGKCTLQEVTARFDNTQRKIGVPLIAAFSTKDDMFRKPRDGSMEYLLREVLKTKKKVEFYVGDAAGRPKINSRVADHSDCDLKLSYNLKAKFFTPEMFFFDKTKDFVDIIHDISSIFERESGGRNDANRMSSKVIASKPISTQLEVVILVGPPACGKSTICKKYYSGYEIINQDTLKSRSKCMENYCRSIRDRRNIVIDNQNRDRKTRGIYIELAKKSGYRTIAIFLDYSKNLIFHLNTFRMITNQKKKINVATVPPVAIHSFFKRVEFPEMSEGIDEIIRLTNDDFEIDEESFRSTEEKNLFYKFLN